MKITTTKAGVIAMVLLPVGAVIAHNGLDFGALIMLAACLGFLATALRNSPPRRPRVPRLRHHRHHTTFIA